MAEIEHVVRVTAKNRTPGQPDVVKLWTVSELIRQAYRWGRIDERAVGLGGPVAFAEEPLSLAGVPLAELRGDVPEYVTDLKADLE